MHSIMIDVVVERCDFKNFFFAKMIRENDRQYNSNKETKVMLFFFCGFPLLVLLELLCRERKCQDKRHPC